MVKKAIFKEVQKTLEANEKTIRDGNLAEAVLTINSVFLKLVKNES